MTDRVSGSNKNPYQVQPTSQKPADDRVKLVRTHARQHSRLEPGVDISSVEKKWSGKEIEKAHGLVTALASPDADARKIAGKLTKLCGTFKDKDLSELLVSKIKELKPETRAAIESKLGWVVVEKMSDDALSLVTKVSRAIAALAKT
jgi:hypothetical protein